MEILLVGGMFVALAATLLALFVLKSHRDAVSVLILFVVVLFAIPARFVLPGMGGAGTPAIVIGLFCAVWWLISKVLPDQTIAYGPQPVRPVVLAYAGWSLITYAFAMRRPLTEIELPGADRAAIVTVALVGITLVAADGISTRRRLDTLVSWIVGMVAFMGVIGAVQFFTSFDPVSYIKIPGLTLNTDLSGVGTRSIFNRPMATALHPIEFGVVSAMTVPLALYRLTLPSPGAWNKVWRLGCLAAVSVGVLVTVSRSAVLGVIIALSVYAVSLTWRRRANLIVASILALVAARVMVPGLVGTISNLFLKASADPSIQGRLSDVDPVLSLLSVHPWLGFGLGTVNPVDYVLLDNQYYGSALSIGLPGLLLLLALVVIGVRSGVRAVRGADETSRRVGYALVGAFLAGGVAMATFDGFSFRIFSGLFFLLLGMIGALWRLQTVGELPTDMPLAVEDDLEDAGTV